jgi:hypothetical protein
VEWEFAGATEALRENLPRVPFCKPQFFSNVSKISSPAVF